MAEVSSCSHGGAEVPWFQVTVFRIFALPIPPAGPLSVSVCKLAVHKLRGVLRYCAHTRR